MIEALILCLPLIGGGLFAIGIIVSGFLGWWDDLFEEEDCHCKCCRRCLF